MTSNFFNINVTEALSVWDGVKESMKVINSRSKDAKGLDYSFITPTLVGKSHVARLSFVFSCFIISYRS
jgi:hypothetical protein